MHRDADRTGQCGEHRIADQVVGEAVFTEQAARLQLGPGGHQVERGSVHHAGRQLDRKIRHRDTRGERKLTSGVGAAGQARLQQQLKVGTDAGEVAVDLLEVGEQGQLDHEQRIAAGRRKKLPGMRREGRFIAPEGAQQGLDAGLRQAFEPNFLEPLMLPLQADGLGKVTGDLATAIAEQHGQRPRRVRRGLDQRRERALRPGIGVVQIIDAEQRHALGAQHLAPVDHGLAQAYRRDRCSRRLVVREGLRRHASQLHPVNAFESEHVRLLGGQQHLRER